MLLLESSVSLNLLPWRTAFDLGHRKIGWHQVRWLGGYLNHATTDDGALQNDSRKMRGTVTHKKATTFHSNPASTTLQNLYVEFTVHNFFFRHKLFVDDALFIKKKKRYQLCFVPRLLQAELYGVSVTIKYSTS